MSTNLVAVINRLFTATILVALLFACQEMPESKDFGGIKLDRQENQPEY